MKKMILSLLTATGLAGVACAQPQPEQAPSAPQQAAAQPAAAAAPAAPPCRRRVNASPAMWQVKDADTTIYLFGTFHLLDACRDWFRGSVKAAFDRSDELVIETVLPENPAELQPLLMRLAVDPQGRTITSRLGEADAAKLRQQLGPVADAFDQAKFEPWFINLTLSNLAAQKLNLNPELGPETVLRRAAAARNMPLSGVETVEFQFNIFDRQPDEAQVKSLRETLADPDAAVRTLRPMLETWSTGNSERLAQIVNEGTTEDPQMHRVLLVDRNAAWARWIQERLQRPGTVFMAVGAGHLGGVGSVQEQLSWLGIESSRVRSLR